MRGGAAFAQEAKQASGAVETLGSSTEKASTKAGVGWGKIAKWAGGAALIYKGTGYLKGAVNQTTTLAKETAGLQRITDLDTRTASSWVTLTKARGISASQFQMGLAKLSK